MGLDISKITNAELKKLANDCDVDKNGQLDKTEYSVFEGKAGSLDNVSAKDYKETLGLYTTDVISGTKSATDGMTEKEAKKFKKEANEAHIKYLDNYAKDGGLLDYTVEWLEAEKPDLDPEFKKAVADVIALMPEYTSTDEIGKKHKEIEKKLGKDELRKNILKELEKAAKNQVKYDRMSDIANLYIERQARYEEKGVSKTNQEIMNEIKQAFVNAGTFKGDIKEAFNNFEQPMADAYKLVYDAILRVDKNIYKGKAVQNAAKDILNKEGHYDKYTEKALYGDRNIFKKAKNWAVGYKNDARVASDNKARSNKVENKKTQTTKEIMDSLGNKSELFAALQEGGFITKTEDGKWDLTVLSNLIGTQVGADYRTNRQTKQYKLISEKLKTTSAMKVATALSDLDEKHAMALVKLCGYEIEGKHWGRAILGGLLGLTSGAAAGYGASMAVASTISHYPTIKPGDFGFDKNLEIPLDVDLSGQKFPEGVSVSATGNLLLNLALLVKNPALVLNISDVFAKMALRTTIPTAVLGAALGVMNGLKDHGETPVLSNNFTETTIEDYTKRIQKENPKYAPVAIMLATTFVKEGGEWDRKGYTDFLNKMGGDGGLINRDELIGGILIRMDEVKNLPKPEPHHDEVENNNNDDDHSYSQTEKHTPIYEDVPTIDGTNTGWKGIAAQYDCLVEKYGESKAIRILKITQAITNGDYSKENIEKLLELSLKGHSNLKGIEGIDYNVYITTIKADYLSKEVKVPVELAGCERDPNKVDNNKYQTKTDNINKPTGSAKDRVQTGTDSRYYARFDGGKVESFDSKAARDQRVAEFKKAHPNAKCEKWEEN